MHHGLDFVQNHVISRSFTEDSGILPESGSKTGTGIKKWSDEAQKSSIQISGAEVQAGLPRPLNSEQRFNQGFGLFIA